MIDSVKEKLKGKKVAISGHWGELGWFLQYYQPHMRFSKFNKYKDYEFVIVTDMNKHPFIEDFVSFTIGMPDWFYDLGLDRDCNEAVLPNSEPGSLTPPNVYSSLILFMKELCSECEEYEMLMPLRGCSFLNNFQGKTYCKYNKVKGIRSDRPIIVVMPRKRVRAPNRNVPEFIWYELVEKLKETFLVIIAGSPSGACLQNYESENVVNIINVKDNIELTLKYLKSAVCSVSSQSGGTHISLLAVCPTYIIGHEKDRHTVELNRFNTPTSFRHVLDYRAIDADTIVLDLQQFITALMHEGWVRDEINRPSLRTLRDNKDLVGVEIGVDAGLNSLNMLESLDIKKLYLIDPYVLYRNLLNIGCNVSEEQCVKLEKEAHERLKGYEDKIVWVRDLSENAYDKLPDELDFVYIDGNHRYEYVKRDLKLYYPKVKCGGLIGCHDYDYPETKKGIDEFFEGLNLKVNCMRCSDNHDRIDAWVVKPTSFDEIIMDDVVKLKELI